MSQGLISTTSYSDIPGRALNFTKQENSTVLKVILDDVMGTSATTTTALNMSWRLTLNGASVGKAKHWIATINGGLNMASRTFQWNLVGLPSGTYSLKIQGKVTGVPIMVMGYPDGDVENSFEVMEITP
jgi:hypothetical protein